MDIYDKCGVRVEFSKPEILLGCVPPELEIFNLIFLVALKFIYNNKLAEKHLSFPLFKATLFFQYQAEKTSVLHCESKLEKMINKWEIVARCFG